MNASIDMVKASKLIAYLQKAIELKGDLPVFAIDDNDEFPCLGVAAFDSTDDKPNRFVLITNSLMNQFETIDDDCVAES